MGQGELDLSLGELHAIDTLQVLGGNTSSSNDLNGTRASAVATSHFVV